MKSLPNNCRMGKVNISPSDWETGGKASLKTAWAIRYRFYDNNTGKVMHVSISDFNRFETVEQRRKELKDALAFETKRLEQNGYNPITGQYIVPVEKKYTIGDISPLMPFLSALHFADSKIEVSKETRQQETTFYLNQIEAAAKISGIANYPVKDIGRRHLLEICEAVSMKADKTKSADKFNRCRKVLKYYYKQLVNYEVAPADPITFDKQKGGVKKVKSTLTAKQQKAISEHLRVNYHNFYLYLQCFYNTAPRSAEMLRLKVKDVDLPNQQIKFLIKKGKQYTEKYRVIPDVAVKFWRMVIGNAPQDYYVFSEGLTPGKVPISPTQINRRWKRLVKDKIAGIEITFYQLKHLRLTDVTDEHGIDEAAKLGAEDAKTVSKYYDLNKDRDNEILRKYGKVF